MRSKFKCVALALLLAPSIVAAKDADGRASYSPVQYLKNFALSTCIANGYKSEEVVRDSLAAAGGYLELGGLPFEAHEEAEALGKTFLANESLGESGEKLVLMKCIDFFNSKELELLARRYRKK